MRYAGTGDPVATWARDEGVRKPYTEVQDDTQANRLARVAAGA